MEEKRLAVVVSITGWLVRGDLTAMLQFVIKNIYVMASQYRASLISEKNTNINIYPPHWFWWYSYIYISDKLYLQHPTYIKYMEKCII